MKVWSIGEMLWDIFPDQELFGGAPLNVCANLQRLGDEATLLSAVGDDRRGELAIDRMTGLGLKTGHIRVVPDLPTGHAIISTSAAGEPSFVIPRPAAFDRVSLDASQLEEARAERIDWLYFGTLLQTESAIERFTRELATGLPKTRRFYDMNLRTGHWNLELVQRLSHLASVLKLNEEEAGTLSRLTGGAAEDYTLESFCEAWAKTYDIDVICVTLGPAGCLVYDRGAACTVPGFKVAVCDTVGSGDAFAAAFLHAYHRHWPMHEAAHFANALGALVASRSGATPEWSVSEVLAMSGSREQTL